ncbi:MAG: VUT family protein [Candidatus Gastranaerophilales bacterium]|nr:VUT family protein [Candidatus Gastranaerophilales bacterium]
MNINLVSEWEDTKKLFRNIPSVVAALFTVSVVVMNIMANKTIFQNEWLALDGGFLISWLSFLCMDIVTKAFGPKAATKLSVFAMFINIFVCIMFYIVSIIPTKEDFSAFNYVIGGTWFILFSSTVAFISSAVINNYLNWGIGKAFKKNANEKLEYVTRTYISTFIGQLCDNLIFASLAFMLFAPIFWNGFHWTFIQCLSSAVLGAILELLMEVIFSPIGYIILQDWKKSGIGVEYAGEA